MGALPPAFGDFAPPPVIEYEEAPAVPQGYRRARESEVPREIDFRQFLVHPMGSVWVFRYLERGYAVILEVHYHPPGGPIKPWGKHKGASLFVEPLKPFEDNLF